MESFFHAIKADLVISVSFWSVPTHIDEKMVTFLSHCPQKYYTSPIIPSISSNPILILNYPRPFILRFLRRRRHYPRHSLIIPTDKVKVFLSNKVPSPVKKSKRRVYSRILVFYRRVLPTLIRSKTLAFLIRKGGSNHSSLSSNWLLKPYILTRSNGTIGFSMFSHSIRPNGF